MRYSVEATIKTPNTTLNKSDIIECNNKNGAVIKFKRKHKNGNSKIFITFVEKI